jgi:hypothetical protein
MPVERVLIDAARMELLANYLLGCPAAEKFYNDQVRILLGWVPPGPKRRRNPATEDPNHLNRGTRDRAI